MKERDETKNYYVTKEEYKSNPEFHKKEAYKNRKELHITFTPEQVEANRIEMNDGFVCGGEEGDGYKIYTIHDLPSSKGFVEIMLVRGNEPGKWLTPVPEDKFDAYMDKLRQNLKEST